MSGHMCMVCDHADQTGSWVDAPDHQDLTHCRDCHLSWPRSTEWQHCISCHRTFSTIVNADRHRKDGGCLDPATVVNKHGERQLFAHQPVRGTAEVWRGPPRSQDSLNRTRQSALEA